MKKYIVFVAVMLTVVLFGNSQTKEDLPAAEERAQMQTEFMKEKLSLNESQVAQVSAINLTAAKRMDKVISMTDRMKKFKEFRSAMIEKDEALKKVLNKEQYKQYEKNKDELKKMLKEKRKEKKKSKKKK